LKNYGVLELNAKEINKTNGGWVFTFFGLSGYLYGEGDPCQMA